MKKIFLLSIMLVFLTGCTSINEDSFDNIVNEALNSTQFIKNTSKIGYRYYKPRGLIIRDSDNYNEIFTSRLYTYYMYVDIVSYYNKIKFSYQENEDAYYSKSLNKDGKIGYIEISIKNKRHKN